MSWPHYRTVVTAFGALDSGACRDGVIEWIEENDGVIAGDPSDYPDNEHIQKAAFANGSGSGSGYGDGYGV